MDKDKLTQLMAALDEVAGKISAMREMLPGDAADEQSNEIDEATADATDGADEDDSKLRPSAGDDPRKAAAVAMLSKSLPG